MHDAGCLLLSAIAAVRAAPAASRLPLRWVPVDFVAAAALALARAPPADAAGRAFNLIGSGPTLAEAAEALRGAGMPAPELPPAAWRNAMRGLAADHPARPLLPAFLRMDVGADLPDDAGALPTAAARALLAARGVPWPAPPAAAGLRAQVEWLRAAGFFSPSGVSGAMP